MINAQNQLKNTAYFHLNKLERSMLISLDCTYIHKTVLLKTRGEGDDARKCAEIRDKAIQAASDLAIKEKEACDDAYESGTTVHAYCYFKAAKKFSKAESFFKFFSVFIVAMTVAMIILNMTTNDIDMTSVFSRSFK